MKKVKVKVHKQKKTERIYDKVKSFRDLCSVIESRGEKTVFKYFTSRSTVKSISYAEFGGMIKKASAGLGALGYDKKTIAIIGETCPEWLCMYIATVASGSVAVPMDKELSLKEIDKFLRWIDADAVAYSPSLEETIKDLRDMNNPVSLYIPFQGEVKGTSVVSFENLLEIGAPICKTGYEYPDLDDHLDDLAEFLFTSGTTGSSKCVMLSQKNIVAATNSACETVDYNPDDVALSVLPMHHTYELMCTLSLMQYGAQICINDSLSHTMKNIKYFSPTSLVLVPLFVSTIHKKIWSEAKKAGKENRLKAAIIASGTMSAAGVDIKSALFSDILSALGGKIKKIICGGAPLDPLLIDAFDHFGITICEGYGITECSPLISVNPYYARKYGSVGLPVPGCEVRIEPASENINDWGYRDGEIEIKGDNVMLGYYDNIEANAEVFTDDGWFRTGDVGFIDDDGYVFITGRKKSVIVLENGKNVFPEEIEEYLQNIEYIAESVVVGRMNQSGKVELTAVVFPAYDRFPEGAGEETVYRIIEKEVSDMNRKLPTFKRVLRVEIRDREFEKTTSRKIKRHLVS